MNAMIETMESRCMFNALPWNGSIDFALPAEGDMQVAETHTLNCSTRRVVAQKPDLSQQIEPPVRPDAS